MESKEEESIKEEQAVDYKAIRAEMESCKRPLYFFHDDPDGLASFLLVYRFIREGKSIVVKTRPNIDLKFLRKVEEYQPDKIFILDIAAVEQDFIDKAKAPIVWIDHHPPLKRNNVKYFNPREKDPKNNIPTSCLCYHAVKQDEWVALVGSIGDYYLPGFLEKVKKEKPELFDADIKEATDIFYKTRFGKLISVFSFILKGKTQDVMKCVKILTRIKNPDEILNQETPQGKFIYKRYKKISERFDPLIKRAFDCAAEQVKQKKDILFFEYTEKEMSFTSGIANRIMGRYPEKLIVIGRKKSGELKCSLRSNNVNLTRFMPKILKGIEGYGGGHEKAAAAIFKIRYKDQFFENIRKELKNFGIKS